MHGTTITSESDTSEQLSATDKQIIDSVLETNVESCETTASETEG